MHTDIMCFLHKIEENTLFFLNWQNMQNMHFTFSILNIIIIQNSYFLAWSAIKIKSILQKNMQHLQLPCHSIIIVTTTTIKYIGRLIWRCELVVDLQVMSEILVVSKTKFIFQDQCAGIAPLKNFMVSIPAIALLLFYSQ